MPTAELSPASPKSPHSASPPRRRRRKPPLALRPLHRMWRRTIDQLDVAHVDLPVRGLNPEHRGVIACQISDFHVDRDEDLARLALAVQTINAQHPDLVFLTGDYFSGPETMRRYLGAFRDELHKLAPKSGVFAILGNHDHWASAERISEALRGAGADLLANESRRVKLNGSELVIVGMDDLWARRAAPARAFAEVRDDDATILLAHNPDSALYVRHLHPGVQLSGHTHGGVVRIPFYGSPLRSILRIGKDFYSGLNRYEDFYIYTNRGLGTFFVRIRINCRPEVSRFSLVPLSELAHQPLAANGAVAAPIEDHPRRKRRAIRRRKHRQPRSAI